MEVSSNLPDLLDRAGKVFTLAGNLGRAFMEERQAQGDVLDSDSWNRHSSAFEIFCNAVLDLRDAMRNPLDGFEDVAERLSEAARIAKRIRDSLTGKERCDPTAYLDYFPDLNTVSQYGRDAVNEAKKAHQPEDPFAFVDQPQGAEAAKQQLAEQDREHLSCYARKGKLMDLSIAIRASGGTPERIHQWPEIRHLLRKRFGNDLSEIELWERFTDWLRVERDLTPSDYLRMPLEQIRSLLADDAAFANGGETAESRKSPPQTCWTPAVFHDKAQELNRRLSVWHIDDPTEPVRPVPFLELQETIRLTFRDVVLKGEHVARPEPNFQLFPGLMLKEDEAKGILGTGFCNLPSDKDKQLTRWLLRDFIEHLIDAGSGEKAKFLKLKVDRILDTPIYCGRPPKNDCDQAFLQEKDHERDGGPHTFIGGHLVDLLLLDELVIAAEAITAENDEPVSNKRDKQVVADEAEATPPKPKGRGRKRASPEEMKRESQLVEDWKQANQSGVYKGDFAKDKGIKLTDLDRLLDRVAARKRRSDKKGAQR